MITKEVIPLEKGGATSYYYRQSWFQLIRPMTLTGTIGPVLAGTGLAAMTGTIGYDAFFILLIATLLIQMSTNIFNDYYDFKHGQDSEKWIASGNADTHYGIKYQYLPIMAGMMLVLATIMGIWLTLSTSPWIIPAGILGMIAGYAYSAGQHSFSAIGLGEVVAAIFLGPVITILSYIVQGQPINLPIILVSLPYTVLIASMILTNNLRDLERDKDFRRTLPLVLGRRKSVYLLSLLLLVAYLTVITLISWEIVPWQVIAILFASPLAIKLIWSLRNDAKRMDEMNGMKLVTIHHWAFGLLFAVMLWVFG